MKAKVQKWGNSLALRIPKAFAAEVGLFNEATVEVTVKGRKLIVEPLKQPGWTLHQLLKGVTRKNLHAEIATGLPQGNEAW